MRDVGSVGGQGFLSPAALGRQTMEDFEAEHPLPERYQKVGARRGVSRRKARALCLLGALGCTALLVLLVCLGASRRDGKTPETLEARVRELRADAPMHSSQVYLDYTGAGVFTTTQLDRAVDIVRSGRCCNTHSGSECALHTAGLIDGARDDVRRFFGAPDYAVVFTANASASVRILVDSFRFGAGVYVYGARAHNSIVGMRDVAAAHGADVFVLHEDRLGDGCGAFVRVLGGQGERSGPGQVLLLLTLESNFSGAVMDSTALAAARSEAERCFGLPVHMALDAAAAAPHRTISLETLRGEGAPVDALVVSFYKLAGYPTGVAALLVEREGLGALLQPSHFAGGTVVLAGAETGFVRPRPGVEERLEDGTPDFLAIPQIVPGLDQLRGLGLGADSTSPFRGEYTARLDRLGAVLREMLGAVTNRAGTQAVEFVDAGHGPIISFRLHVGEAGATYVACPAMVSGLAALEGMAVRGGCHCNPGECYAASGLDESELRAAADQLDFCGAVPEGAGPVDALGAVRVSLGYLSTQEDLDRFVALVERVARETV